MADNVIVMVLDPDDGKHGEFNVLTEPEEAAHLVESLLESGYGQERIRVFNADELEMTVSQRPVVSLVGGIDTSGGASTPPSEEPTDEREGELVAANARSARAKTQEEVAATPFVKDGVRFSSLFKPA